MQELITLIGKIDAVIHAYITRYGVTDDDIDTEGYDNIFANLKADINFYKKLSLVKAETDVSGFISSVTSVVRSIFHKAEEVVRYYTSTDGAKRLATLEWLFCYRNLFQAKLEAYKEIKHTGELRLFGSNLNDEIRAFYAATSRILTSSGLDEHAFTLKLENSEFVIQGLRDTGSDLVALFQQNLTADETVSASIAKSFQQEFRTRARIIVATMAQQVHEAKLAKQRLQYEQEIAQHDAQLEQEKQRYEKEMADKDSRFRAMERLMQERVVLLQRELDQTKETVANSREQLEASRKKSESLEKTLEEKDRQFLGFIDEKSNLEKALIQQHETQSNSAELHKALEEMKVKLRVAESNLTAIEQEREQLKAARAHEIETQQSLESQISFAESRQDELHDAAVLANHYEEDDDEFDIDKLQHILKNVKDASVVQVQTKSDDEQEISTPMQPSNSAVKRFAHKKDKFPLMGEAHTDGLTLAQYYVIEGNYSALKYLLEKDPSAVNSLPEEHSNKLNKNTLLELAMFEKRYKTSFDTQKKIIELILSYRPIIFHSDLNVFLNISQRLASYSSFSPYSPVLRTLFCHYVIAQKTCSVVARTEFFDMMNEIEDALKYLSTQANVVLLDGFHLDELLSELEEPIKICRLMKYAYQDQRYDQLEEYLKSTGVKEMANAEKVSVLDDDDTRVKAYMEYLTQYKQPPLLERLLTVIKPRIDVCLFSKRRQYIGMDRVLDDNSDNQSNSNASFKWKEVEAPKIDDTLGHYRVLLLNLQKIISHHGSVLLSTRFNDYQKEMIKSQCQQANVAPVRVAPASSFYGSQPTTPRSLEADNEASLKFG